MRRVIPVLCVLLLLGAFVAPATARPPPRDVSGFAGGFDGGQYQPYDYPASNVSNVTLTVAVSANGTSAWTERATLTNPEAADALRANETLRRAVVASRFDHRFARDTGALHSRVRGDTLVVTYRLAGVVHRASGSGLLLAPFADYRNVYEPGRADVTIHAPAGYRVVSHPAAMASAGDALRWNATTGAGDAGVSPGLVTFAPASAALPELRAELAVLATYGLSTLGIGAAYALLFGLPLALVGSGSVALAGRRSRDVWGTLLGVVAATGVGAAIVHYPATGSVVAHAFHPFLLTFVALPLALLATVAGLGLHAVARRRV